MIASDAPAMDAPAFLGAGMSNAALATRPGLTLGPQPSAAVLLLEIAIRTAKDVPGPFPPSVVEYLLVAGGGAGRGGPYGGGGGGGGVRAGNLNISPGSQIPIIIGAGGAASNGSNSAIADVTAIGGGIGGDTYQAGANGGSGGGGGFGLEDNPTVPPFPPGGSGIAGQGYPGGNGSPFLFGEESPVGGGGGGGGGAGGPGQHAPPYSYWFDGGDGGPGLISSINGSAISYGAGGGGSGDGLGGSGAGNGWINPPQDGAANRGDGGGAGYWGGQGGSGFAVLRYPDSYALPAAITGGGTIITSGGFHIITFTASGSVTF